MDKILQAVKEAREKSKKRKFSQSWDVAIGLRNIDLKKPENKLNLEYPLPEGMGKEVKNCFIVDNLLPEAKDKADLIITKNELEALGKNKKLLKKHAEEYAWWFCEAPLMPMVGKSLGIVLGPRGRMPKPIPPKGSIEPFIRMSKVMIRVRVRESPVIHVSVGNEAMDDEKVARNITGLVNFVKEKLPKGAMNIRNVHIKLTMGKPVKIEV